MAINRNSLAVFLLAGFLLPPPGRAADSHLDLARKAAAAFCLKFNFPPEKIDQLKNPPLHNLTFERKGLPVQSIRWLGGGRGDYYVQVEIEEGSDLVIVHGGYGHKEFGPWAWTAEKTLVAEGVGPFPEGLYQAYEKFVKAASTGDAAEITALALPQSVNRSLEKKGFQARIELIRSEGNDCWLLRTSTSALWYVRTRNQGWKLYRYLDKSIE